MAKPELLNDECLLYPKHLPAPINVPPNYRRDVQNPFLMRPIYSPCLHRNTVTEQLRCGRIIEQNSCNKGLKIGIQECKNCPVRLAP